MAVDDVTVGSVWYVWGKHQEVIAERNGALGREVKLAPVGRTEGRGINFPWVEARRVEKHGKPSSAFNETTT